MNDANGVILRPRRQVCMPLPIAPHRNLRIPIILRQYAGAESLMHASQKLPANNATSERENRLGHCVAYAGVESVG